MNNILECEPMNLDSLRKNPIVMIIGKHKSGKTILSRSILQHLNDIPRAVIITNSKHREKLFNGIFKETSIYDTYKPEIFQEIISMQCKITKESIDFAKKDIKTDARLLLLIDDCLHDNEQWIKDMALREILFNGRHWNITCILTMQSLSGICPGLRSNADYVFILKTHFLSLQLCYNLHVHGWLSSRNFKELYNGYAANYGALIIDKSLWRPYDNKLFHFRAAR